MTGVVPTASNNSRSRPATIPGDPVSTLPPAVERVARACWRGSVVTGGTRVLPEEVPVALTYNGSSHAVMMASPCDLEDFAVGFSLTEGIIAEIGQIETLDVVGADDGIELRLWIEEPKDEALRERRRRLMGPTGCGLCGVESLAEMLRPLRPIESTGAVPVTAIRAALEEITAHQKLNQQTHAVHAAAFCRPGHGMILREDVGRHNALDKLAGALARSSLEPAGGFLILSSRVSIDIVQKATAIGVPVIVAMSAPTAFAVRACEAAALTLIAIARSDGFELFTHPYRIIGGAGVGLATRA
jgi:FdhD protein